MFEYDVGKQPVKTFAPQKLISLKNFQAAFLLLCHGLSNHNGKKGVK
jgi:hypothetical protein